MDDIELKNIIEAKLKASISESSGLESDQQDALDIYNGELYGNEVAGRSTFVTRDVMEQIEWTMPSLMRVFASGTRFVEFEPDSPEDEKQAEHETDVVNELFRKSEGWQVFYDWFKTALIHKIGYVKAYYDVDTEVVTEQITVPDIQLPEITEDESIEILSKDERTEIDQMGMPVLVYDLEVRRKVENRRLRIDVVPGEEMRVSKSAKTINVDDIDFIAHETELKVSECLERGWPKNIVEEAAGFEDDDFYRSEYEDDDGDDEIDKSLRLVKVAECYLYADYDDDGIAEYRRVIKLGSHIVENDPWGENPFEAITPVPMPHQHIGNSLTDQVEDIQRAKTDLFRQVIDNLRLTNNPEKEVVWNQISNPDDLLTSHPGGLKRVKAIGSINPLTVPFTAGASVPILQLLDSMKEARTGISRHTMGLDANALAQSTRGAFMGAMNQANQRTELIARIFAETGVKGLFRKIHSLIIENEQEPINVRINNQWQQANPAQWKKRKNLVVNVGLGTGNKDEQLARLVNLAERQVQLLQSGLPIVTPKNVYNTLVKVIEAADLKEPSLYLTDPDLMPPQEPQPPSIEEQIAQAQMEIARMQQENQAKKNAIEEQKLQLEMVIAQEKVKDAERNQVKGQQDIMLKSGESERRAKLEETKLATELQLKQRELELKEKELEMDYQKQIQDFELKLTDSMSPVVQSITQLQAQMTAPKRIVRDEQGNIVGVEQG